MDEYGFKRPEDFDYTSYEKIMSVYYTVLANRRRQWERFMAKKPNLHNNRSGQLKRYIRKGIPGEKTACQCIVKTYCRPWSFRNIIVNNRPLFWCSLFPPLWNVQLNIFQRAYETVWVIFYIKYPNIGRHTGNVDYIFHRNRHNKQKRRLLKIRWEKFRLLLIQGIKSRTFFHWVIISDGISEKHHHIVVKTLYHWLLHVFTTNSLLVPIAI